MRSAGAYRTDVPQGLPHSIGSECWPSNYTRLVTSGQGLSIAGEKKATILLLFSKKEPKKSPFLSKNSVIFGDLATFFCVFCNALDCAGESCTAKLLTAEAEHDTGRAIGFVSVCSFAVLGSLGTQAVAGRARVGFGWLMLVVGSASSRVQFGTMQRHRKAGFSTTEWLPEKDGFPLHCTAKPKQKEKVSTRRSAYFWRARVVTERKQRVW